MPRRDGFDTNAELMNQVEVASHQLFVAAYERSFAPRIPTDFEGKPFANLELWYQRVHQPETVQDDDPLLTETLLVRPIQDTDQATIEDHVGWKNNPEILADRSAAIAEVAQLSINQTLHPAQLPPSRLVAQYTAGTVSGRLKTINTTWDKPVKQRLYGALGFLEAALQQTQSATLELTGVSRMPQQLAQLALAGEISPGLHGGWQLHLTPDMPLHGEESLAFLLEYQQFLAEEKSMAEHQLQRRPDSPLANFNRRRVTTAAATLYRLTAILRQRAQEN